MNEDHVGHGASVDWLARACYYTVMGQRHALVVGSQCASLRQSPLSFLPQRAERLYDVLTDPGRGGCLSRASALVIDPDLSTLATAVEEAVTSAASAEAALVLAFVGHAEKAVTTVDNDLFLMPIDATLPPNRDSAYPLGLRLWELIQGPHAVGLDGLLLLIDACYAGIGVLSVAERAARLVASAGIRLEMLAATFDRTARDGCFSKALTGLLEQGLPGVSNDYIDSSLVLDRIALSCRQQEEPLRIAMARGRRIMGDPGLWLAHNPEASGRWALAGTSAGGHAVELTRSYQITDALEEVQAGMASHRLTIATGGAGSGKSALVAALARPELASDLIPATFLHAVAFADLSPTAVDLANALAEQMVRREDFKAATKRYNLKFSTEELNQQPAFERQIVGPLLCLQRPVQRKIRIAVDGGDQLEPSAQQELNRAVTRISNSPELEGVRILLTCRKTFGTATLDRVQSGVLIELKPPDAEAASNYARTNGVPDSLVSFAVANTRSWLDLQLLSTGIAAVDLSDQKGFDTLDDLYQARVAAATRSLGENLIPLLSVLSASGSGPVAPIAIVASASGRLQGVHRVPEIRDLLAGLGTLVARANPGTDAEHVGLFHETFVDYLRRHLFDQAAGVSGHQAILDALDGDSRAGEAAVAYKRGRVAEHLWAVGRLQDALYDVAENLGLRPADNVNMLDRWMNRTTTTLGRDHPYTLGIRNDHAAWLGTAGDVPGAVNLLEGLVADRSRVLGADHPDTLNTRGNLAYFIGESGDLRGARGLLRSY